VSTLPLVPGRTFDRYEILALVGQGGMGRVYRAYDQRLRRDVALKVLSEGTDGDARRVDRMIREARAAAALSHPNAVCVYDAGEHEGLAFIAMELVQGRSLRSFVGDIGVPLERRVRWLADIAHVLAAAHERGIVHRDVKPENVVIRSDGVVKVLDFGIARRVAPFPRKGGEGTGDTITQAGTLVGTPVYMAPEQIAGHPFDQRVDQFAWGVLAYELLTGSRPWPTNDLHAIAAILQQAVDRPSARAPEIPPEVDRTVLRALEKDPADRFAAMSELASSLTGEQARRSGASEDSVDSAVHDRTTLRTEGAIVLPRAKGGARSLGLVALLVVALGAGGTLAVRSAVRPASIATATPPSARVAARRSFAVLGLRDPGADVHAQPTGGAWRTTAMSELLTAELSAGGWLRAVPGDRVAAARRELGLGGGSALGQAEIQKLQLDLGVDLFVMGTLIGAPAPSGARDASVRLEVFLVDARTGNTIATVADAGSEAEPLAIIARVATALRRSLELAEPSADQRAAVGVTMPAGTEAARTYAEALDAVRRFDDTRAADLFKSVEALDPTFALAYAEDAATLARMGRDEDARATARRGLELAAGLPREERLWVEATYHAAAGERDAAARKYQALFTFFPDNVDYAVSLLHYTSIGGHPKDTLAEIERLRATSPAIADDPRVGLEEARAAHMSSDYDHALRAAIVARKTADERGMRLVYERLGYYEGIARNNLGHPEEGLRVLEESDHLARALGDAYTANMIARPMAYAYVARGDVARARTVASRARDESAARGDTYHATSSAEQLAAFDVLQGDVEGGLHGLTEAIAFYRAAHEPHALSGGLPDLAVVVAAQGDPAGAEAIANEGIEVARSNGRKTMEAAGDLALAYVARLRRDAATEARHEAEALALYQTAQSRSGEAEVRRATGEQALYAGELGRARTELEGSLGIDEALGNQLGAADTRTILARVALEEGHAADAEVLARASLAVFERAEAASRRAMALAVLARASVAQGASDGGEALAHEAETIATTDVAARLRTRLDCARARTRSSAGGAARAERRAVEQAATAAHHEEIADEARRLLALEARSAIR